jgi:hypothetical protein
VSPPLVLLSLARELNLDARRRADAARRAGASRPGRRPLADDAARVTLRLDRVSDSSALYELAELCERRLPTGRLVVAELDNRVVAAVTLDGRERVYDPFVRTEHLWPLLALRAAQIQGVDVRAPMRRLLPRRA